MQRSKLLIVGLAISAAMTVAAVAAAQSASQRERESIIATEGRWFLPPATLQPEGRIRLDVPSGTVPAPLPEAGTASIPPPIYGPTTGTLVGERAAMEKAASLAVGPILRQEARLLAYKDISAFAGSIITTIHPDRLFYMVVTAAPWQPSGVRGPSGTCPSYIAVVDAENAQTRGILCGNAVWPTRLPPQFGQ